MPDPKDHGRLPPGQYLTRDLPVMQIGSVPHTDETFWSLKVTGLVQSPVTLNLEEFRALPRVRVVADIHCVTSWSCYDLEWEGVPVHSLLRRARPTPEAAFVHIHADGGYTTNLPLAALMDDDVILADRLNGEPLPDRHGGPARLLVPKRYAYKSAKWVRVLELTAEDRPGFWESRGYSNDADPATESRFADLEEPEPPPSA